ncbi:MAG: hypothetical protein IJC71_03315 [Clostridia bacterium]|nr:hypothetical protein [Clostridia bacterium]
MIHPSIGELTNNGQINRYTLVVATAKCARIITDEYVRQKELAEKLALSKESEKKSALTAMIKREYRDEKAVKNAISGLYSGEFKIVDEAEKAEEAEKEEAEEAEETAEENTAEEAADEE